MEGNQRRPTKNKWIKKITFNGEPQKDLKSFQTCVQKNIFHVKKDMEQNKIGFEASWRELFEHLRYKGGKT